jgi:hypothetical protein
MLYEDMLLVGGEALREHLAGDGDGGVVVAGVLDLVPSSQPLLPNIYVEIRGAINLNMDFLAHFNARS